ncbi:TIGR03571 family LLM class oxidoreductase [Gluconobacter sp. LMG 1745]|uniref:TIGR03571 family LLM class oxidoreductase n=2 Tax=Gluconobacter cadivus TaxID=2728101 RepID=A0ABR9YXT3_9PROT|nr:TIGR03571 family LLM class oxidoreductase [Gluconobacter cadivus]
MTMTLDLRFESHPGFRRLFAPGHLTIGLIMPLETYPGRPGPTMNGHLEMARLADSSALGALWMRDIPFYDPHYGDVGQVFESLIYISALSAVTTSITLGTAGIILPFREPKILAKQVMSLDHLSDGRMVLGLSSGDRPAEYPIFDIDYSTRGERFRDAFNVYKSISENDFPTFFSSRFGKSEGTHDLIPKAAFEQVPSIAVGRSQQSLDWIARHMDGLLVPSPPVSSIKSFVTEWQTHVRETSGSRSFKPLGIAGYLDLVEDRDYPFEAIRSGFRSGSRTLASFLEVARDAGVNHVAFNPSISRRPYTDIMDNIIEDILPYFPALSSKS